jgi:hypothetical protein
VVSISTGKQARQKCRNVFIFEILVAIASIENILHYFSTPKLQGGKPGFEVKIKMVISSLFPGSHKTKQTLAWKFVQIHSSDVD